MSESIQHFVLLILGGSGVLLLLMLSAVISSAEVAFFSLSKQQLLQCTKSSNEKENQVAKLLRNSRKLLATILILSNLVNIAFITTSGYFLWALLGKSSMGGLGVVIYTIISSASVVLLGEVIPKIYATTNNLSIAKKTVSFLIIANTLLKPVASLLLAMGDMFGKRLTNKSKQFSESKLDQAIALATENEIPKEEKKILKEIVKFGKLTVKQVMQPRTEITAIELNTDYHQVMNVVNKSGYSRIPVYKETIDNIEGVLQIKDLLPYLDEEDTFQWQKLLRPCFFVPEHKKIDVLLLDFQERRVHLAIVVDEYGGTEGLVTMEDVIEEIIGDINDEFDQQSQLYKKVNHTTYIFEGRILLNDLCKVIGEDIHFFDAVKGESESLAGLLLELFGRLPKTNEKIIFSPFEFTVIAVDARKIKRVKLKKM